MANPIADIQLINKILKTKDWSVVTRYGLDETYFPGCAAEFKFLEQHKQKYGNVADEETFTTAFQNFQWMDVSEVDQYLIEQVFENVGYRTQSECYSEYGKLLQQDSNVSYDYLVNTFVPKCRPRSVCNGIDIIASAQERYEIYKNRSNATEPMTISTGLQELDDIFGGWEFGDELVTIVARTNQGKSWILMKFLAEAWKQGKRVGLYSGEMNHIKLGYRFDALFGHFSNRAITQGLQTAGYDEYIQNLTEMSKKNGGIFQIVTQKEFGGKPTVQQIRSFVENNNLDIIGIDQLSLMRDGRMQRGDMPRLQLSHIAEDLFLLSSERKIPVLALAQANREGAKKEGETDAPGLENIKESDDIAHNSSKCIGMRQSNFGLVLDIIKNREGRVGDKLLYSWDIDTGHFAYIPSADDAAKPEIRQQTVQQDKKTFEPSLAANPF